MNEESRRLDGSWNRRDFLIGAAACTAVAGGRRAKAALPAAEIPIIDTHIHLFDASRPQGAPYKGPKEFTSHISLPAEYRALAAPLGIVGAIAVEASHWVEDNLWLLEAAQTDDIMVGTIGHLQPEKPEFAEYLERYRKNPLYRGIRFDNRGTTLLAEQIDNPPFIEGLKLLSQADLVLDTANPSTDLLEAIVRVNDEVPNLRIIIDHLPVMDPTPAELSAYKSVLAEIHGRPNIFVKLSEILHRVKHEVALDLASHRERLDYLMDVFGEDRVLFGSDYPNSVGTATLGQVVSLTKQYFAGKSRTVAEKYFWKNSVSCYKWIRRDAAQRRLV
ncbi:MAG: putative metal-dependent hydrolase of the TIM-barrel fold protein [Gammaproteobacteria bacterium]|nr:putative metal-dependent hydrolase of the TIM-barrel fold protein [Gammaproteobacteria bacterium]